MALNMANIVADSSESASRAAATRREAEGAVLSPRACVLLVGQHRPPPCPGSRPRACASQKKKGPLAPTPARGAAADHSSFGGTRWGPAMR